MKPRLNSPLIFGALLIALTSVLAIWGPDLAPRDPLERVSGLIRIDGVWERAPFPPGPPGFPLGSDQGGRDILSRLLWAVRPTMQLVLIVALVRLGVGILVGIVSGAGRGRPALLLETLTTAALAVPSLLIALVIVLKLWPTWGGAASSPGLRAFIIGLSITGWAETAQVVREGTRILLRQQYVEAARSLGGSAVHLFRRYVLPHLMPLVWIQMAFEVGATLMLVAGMGFLGIYVGGTAEALEGDPFTLAAAPELGEMLSTSIDVIVEPWGMVAAGGVVFLTVLGFNLLGQGLRLARALPRRETIASRAGFWLEEYVIYPVRLQAAGPLRWPLRIVVASILLAAVVRIGMDLRPAIETRVEQLPTEIERALAPLPTPTATPAPEPDALLWTFESPTGAPIPPIVAADGRIYLLTHDDELYAFSPDGAPLWQRPLDPAPFKARISQSTGLAIPPVELPGGLIGIVSSSSVYALGPDGEPAWEARLEAPPGAAGCCAVDPAGRLHLADSEGSLYAFGAGGERLWKYTRQDGPAEPVSDPVAASDGRVYIAVSLGSDVLLAAVSPEGDLLWESPVPRDRFRQAFVGANRFDWLALSPEEDLVFLSGDVYLAETGEWVDFDLESAVAEIETQLEAEDSGITAFGDVATWARRVFPGPDGRVIMVVQFLLIEWLQVPGGFEMSRFLPIHASYPVTGWRPPPFAAGDTVVLMAADPNDGDDVPQLPWDTGGWFLIWNDLAREQSGEVQVPPGDYLAPLDPEAGAALVCRAQRDPALLTCERWDPRQPEPETLFSIEGIRSLKYLELDPGSGRLYVFGKDNTLYVADVGEVLAALSR